PWLRVSPSPALRSVFIRISSRAERTWFSRPTQRSKSASRRATLKQALQRAEFTEQQRRQYGRKQAPDRAGSALDHASDPTIWSGGGSQSAVPGRTQTNAPKVPPERCRTRSALLAACQPGSTEHQVDRKSTRLNSSH